MSSEKLMMLAYHKWLTRLDDVETATFKSAFFAGAEAALAAHEAEQDQQAKDAELVEWLAMTAEKVSQRKGRAIYQTVPVAFESDASKINPDDLRAAFIAADHEKQPA